MNYSEITDNIKSLVEAHYMINEFGVGDISDIKAKNEIGNNQPNYPYLFLNPALHTRNGNVITYRFNMIIMDMVSYDKYTKIQSDCIQYADDIIARFNDINKIYQININNIQYSIFKERFQDTVAGCTATVEINIAKPIDKCILPYNIGD